MLPENSVSTIVVFRRAY